MHKFWTTIALHTLLISILSISLGLVSNTIFVHSQGIKLNQSVEVQQTVTLQAVSFAGANFTTTSGNIYKNGQLIKLFGVSWFGFEDDGHSTHALWKRNLTDIILQVKAMGFNAFRLPFCPQTLANVPTGYISNTANPTLVGLKSLDLMDKVIEEMSRQGMYILLDIHNYDCTNTLPPLWYTPAYSEQQLITDLTFVANRYKNVENVVGIDIKNMMVMILHLAQHGG
jgi:endoglucanase